MKDVLHHVDQIRTVINDEAQAELLKAIRAPIATPALDDRATVERKKVLVDN